MSGISESLRASDAYKNASLMRANTWWGTSGPIVYEVEFTRSETESALMTVSALMIGYDGPPTQFRLLVGKEGSEKFVFIDRKGRCEHSFCPSFDETTVKNAHNIYLFTERGKKIRLARREDTG